MNTNAEDRDINQMLHEASQLFICRAQDGWINEKYQTQQADLPTCPKCGEAATYQTPDGTWWDSNGHYWRALEVK